jgi:hypothetical protein
LDVPTKQKNNKMNNKDYMFYAFLYLATAKKKASKKAVVIKTKSRIC